MYKKAWLPFASLFATFHICHIPHFRLHYHNTQHMMHQTTHTQKHPIHANNITPPRTIKCKYQLFVVLANIGVICAFRICILSRFSVFVQMFTHIPFFERLPLRCLFSIFIHNFFCNFFVILLCYRHGCILLLPYSIELFICLFLGVLTAFVSLLV